MQDARHLTQIAWSPVLVPCALPFKFLKTEADPQQPKCKCRFARLRTLLIFQPLFFSVVSPRNKPLSKSLSKCLPKHKGTESGNIISYSRRICFAALELFVARPKPNSGSYSWFVTFKRSCCMRGWSWNMHMLRLRFYWWVCSRVT